MQQIDPCSSIPIHILQKSSYVCPPPQHLDCGTLLKYFQVTIGSILSLVSARPAILLGDFVVFTLASSLW